MTFTPGTDTLIFGAIAVLCASWLIVSAWYRRILRDLDKMEDDCLNDDDMRDEP